MKRKRFLISGLVMAGVIPSTPTHPMPVGYSPNSGGIDPDEDQLLQRFAQDHQFTLAQHRSHQSHSSHSSHRSGTSGRTRSPPPAPAPRIPRATPAPAPTPAPRSSRNESSTPPSSILPSSPATTPQTLLSPNSTAPAPSATQIRTTIMQVQISLLAAGYYDGEIDGIIGPMTRDAIERYQRDNGMAVTGTITPEVLDAFRLTLD
ncbi:MAG: His-Xaa-Ser repeat protein HxsA [Verrucomicrobiae bacterium]|nr:His-Xaa-Ser repeat protein HxsA [Verrucomicrobiae bacterium]